MKKLILFCLLFFSVSFLNAQTSYEYDASGNQISRVIVLPAHAPMQQSSPRHNEDEQGGEREQGDKVYADKLNESDILIYPNPTQGMLAVEIRNKNLETPHLLTVLNLNGKPIFQQLYSGSYLQIDLSSQPKGVYLLRISSQETMITWKIIKE